METHGLSGIIPRPLRAAQERKSQHRLSRQGQTSSAAIPAHGQPASNARSRSGGEESALSGVPRPARTRRERAPRGEAAMMTTGGRWSAPGSISGSAGGLRALVAEQKGSASTERGLALDRPEISRVMRYQEAGVNGAAVGGCADSPRTLAGRGTEQIARSRGHSARTRTSHGLLGQHRVQKAVGQLEEQKPERQIEQADEHQS